MSLRALRSRFNDRRNPTTPHSDEVTTGFNRHASQRTSEAPPPLSSGSDDMSSSPEDLGESSQNGGRGPLREVEDGTTRMYDKRETPAESEESVQRRKERTQRPLSQDRRISGLSTASKCSGSWDEKEKDIYEAQLRMLQEQLVDSMIENQALSSEIAKFKSNSDLIRTMQLYDEEKERGDKLSQDCDELQHQLDNVDSYSMGSQHLSTDLGEEAITTLDHGETSPTKPSWRGRTAEWTMAKIYEIIADFTEEQEEEKQPEKSEEEELTIKKLKANIKRFKTSYQPIVHWLVAINNLLTWKSRPASFLAFTIYTYCIWNGWIISLVLGLTLWHLTKTYMISKGFAIKFSLLPYTEEEENNDVDKQLGLTDKFQLVLLVARRVQHYMAMIADGLEKLQNLVMWGNQDITQQVYTSLLSAFIASIILPGSWIITSIGLFLGFKFFISHNVFKKFPRIKAKHDNTYIMWQSLPTHAQKERSKILETRRKYVIPAAVTETPGECRDHFCKVFSLPSEEVPMSGWQGGKRCTQIIREKTVSFRTGRLYLTRSFLCFERARKNMDKNIVIPLVDIIKIQKAKPFFLIPGMSIEIQVVNEEKSTIFGAILNRDEVFAVILRQVCNIRDMSLKDKDMKMSPTPSSAKDKTSSDSKSASVNTAASTSGSYQ